ncbi:MAG: UDP-N-acetylmuramoylalanine--D-glutamate ligase [Porticoccaceae bacterium]|nr:MAG: UDP-N-acetylmuramoylalanine--D-glutamate ligase [Porticoccaceae bacterium]
MARAAFEGMTVVLGLGATGLSVARFLAARGEPFCLADTRPAPPGLAAARAAFPEVAVVAGPLGEVDLTRARQVVASPGVPWDHPALAAAREAGVPVLGDLALFLAEADAPVVAITGTNGKSTVTTLVGQMAAAAGRAVGVGGNLGPPALDLLAPGRDLYVLEVSSFQLEYLERPAAQLAVLLNFASDHLDRHGSEAAYLAAKRRVFAGARGAVVNRDDPHSQPPREVPVAWTFGLDRPPARGFGLVARDGGEWLACEGEALLPAESLLVRGRHNLANALAALAIGRALELPMAAMLEALARFPGLPHRCQTVALRGGVAWIDDSKATNEAAAVAAVEGLAGKEPDLVLLAGGMAKGQSFARLAAACAGKVRHALLFGADADRLAAALAGAVAVERVADLAAAVARAAELARPGDKVLLAPACASHDQFADYAARGRAFAAAVEGLS